MRKEYNDRWTTPLREEYRETPQDILSADLVSKLSAIVSAIQETA